LLYGKAALAQWHPRLEVFARGESEPTMPLTRRLAIAHRADKNPDDREAAEARFKEIAEAFNILSDPEKRQIYDRFGMAGLEAGSGSGGGGDSGGTGFATVDPHELFAQFFQGFGQGGAFGARFMGGNPFGDFVHPRSFPNSRGGAGARNHFGRVLPRVVKIELVCSLEELFTGTTKRMKVRRRNLSSESESSRPSSTVLEIHIKPGWKANTRITFRGAGDEVAPGEFQDVMFILTEKKHERFTREGSNLWTRHKVSLKEALTGFHFEFKHLDGSNVSVDVDHVVRPGSRKVIAGRGMPSSKRPNQCGDLVVEFEVDFPERLDDNQKQALRATL